MCFAAELICRPDSYVRDGPAVLLQKYNSGWVVGVAGKIDSNILSTFPLILHGIN